MPPLPVPDATARKLPPDVDALRREMEAARLSLAEAAKRCGVSTRTLERYLSPGAVDRGDWLPYPLHFTLQALCLRNRKDQAE